MNNIKSILTTPFCFLIVFGIYFGMSQTANNLMVADDEAYVADFEFIDLLRLPNLNIITVCSCISNSNKPSFTQTLAKTISQKHIENRMFSITRSEIYSLF